MSHEIYKNDCVVTAGERAWHGLDVNKESWSFDAAAGAVTTLEPVYFPMSTLDPITGQRIKADHRAVYMTSREVFEAASVDNKVDISTAWKLIQSNYAGAHEKTTKVGEVGPSYTPLLNRELVQIIRPIAESGLVSVETAGTLFNGLKIWFAFKLDEYEPLPGDTRVRYLVAFNSHDSSLAPGFLLTEVRVVCNNTFKVASKATKKLTVRHSSQVVQNMEELAETVDLIRGEFIAHEQKLQELAKITIQDEAQLRKIIRITYGLTGARKGRTEDRLVDLFESAPGNKMQGISGTGLALHEAFTYFLTHEAGNKKSDQETRFNNNLFLDINRKLIDRLDTAILVS